MHYNFELTSNASAKKVCNNSTKNKSNNVAHT